MRKRQPPSNPPDGNEVSYLMHLKDGNLRRITVPSHWRVTFGPLVPGREGRGNPSLRFYEGENQRACFTDVESFRQEGIKIEERSTQVKQQTVRKKTDHGYKDVIVEARVTEWRDPDRPEDNQQKDEDFLQIGAFE